MSAQKLLQNTNAHAAEFHTAPLRATPATEKNVLKHFIKDMGIAIESAEELGLVMPGLKLAKSLYDSVAADGGADDGTHALFRYYFEGNQG